MEFRNVVELKKDLRQVLQYNRYLDFETAQHSGEVSSGILVDKAKFPGGFLHSEEEE